ncbi:MAG: hypothetical protein ACRD3D_06240 [Terriglobia bacterium]
MSAVQVGLVKYFSRERTVLMNADADSRDGTVDLVKAAAVRDYRSFLASSPLRSARTITASYHPGRGQAGALRLLMAAADLLRAKACAVVSPDSASITPEWIEALIRPVYRDGFDLLSPVYQRHRFEGLLVRNVLAPMLGAAYGYAIEEPSPDELGFSGALARHFLAQDVWQEDFMRAGAFMWITASALAGNFHIGQSFLGPKTHAGRNSGPGLAETIQHVVGALFSSLETYENSWRGRTTIETVPLFGFPSEIDLAPLRVNRKKAFEMFRNGTPEIAGILAEILSPDILNEILRVAQSEEVSTPFPDELWVKTVYEFAASYHHRVMNRDHLLQALTPLYRGRVSSYLRENRGLPLAELRGRREALQREFERWKPYLVEKWSAKA